MSFVPGKAELIQSSVPHDPDDADLVLKKKKKKKKEKKKIVLYINEFHAILHM